MDLEAYFTSVEAQMKEQLNSIRATLDHGGNKGTRAEESFRAFLSSHIARKFEVGHGEVVDLQAKHVGSISGPGQIDILVIDDAHPRFMPISSPSLYFFDGVLAAGEIKASLRLSDLESIIEKAAKFKELNTILAAGDMTFTSDADMKRYLTRRPYFLFAFESSSPLQSVYSRMKRIEMERALGETEHLDGIFILGRGTLLNLGDGKGSLCSFDEQGNRRSGWLTPTRGTLVSFITWINIVMPYIVRNSSILARALMPSAKQNQSVQATTK